MKVLAISDTQIPFEHPDALAFCKAIAKKEKPDLIFQMGDLIDVHSTSDYDPDPDGYSPGHELEKTREKLKAWVKAFPKVTILLGNHDVRYHKAALKARIPADVLKSFSDILQTPKGWEYVEEVVIDEVLYTHGDGATGVSPNASIELAKSSMMSTVHGHFHVNAGIQYYANKRHLVFAFNTGCLIDRKSYAFNYGKKLTKKPILGIGVIENGVPKFIPMKLSPSGRWTGKL
jgi:predicted phosphodiesterase